MDKDDVLAKHFIEAVQQSDKEEVSQDYADGFTHAVEHLAKKPMRLQEYKHAPEVEEAKEEAIATLHNRHTAKIINAVKKQMSFYTNDISDKLEEIEKTFGKGEVIYRKDVKPVTKDILQQALFNLTDNDMPKEHLDIACMAGCGFNLDMDEFLEELNMLLLNE
jgi:hypothetical protein